jgi:hypothetical protein
MITPLARQRATHLPFRSACNRIGLLTSARFSTDRLHFNVTRQLGASLARLEARVVFETLVPELLRLAPSERTMTRIDSFLIRGPKRLPLQRAA